MASSNMRGLSKFISDIRACPNKVFSLSHKAFSQCVVGPPDCLAIQLVTIVGYRRIKKTVRSSLGLNSTLD
eukprot:551618-Pyramimonas_sp.AAC.1